MDPKLSVVIASVNGAPWILDCLASLEDQSAIEDLEILVGDRVGGETARAIQQRFPAVRLETGLDQLSIPELRWRGIRRARAPIVAVIEDHALAEPGWAEAVLGAHEHGHQVVGGPVENAQRDSILGCVLFLIEYAPAQPPTQPGSEGPVGGMNISYRKSVLPLEDDRYATLWDGFLFDELRRRGVRFHREPKMLLRHRTPYGFAKFFVQRYHYSRSFAAMRARPWSRRWPLLRGLAYASVSWMLFPLLLAALTRRVFRKRRDRMQWLLGQPAVWALLASGIVGEALGSVLGDGGSLRRVK